MSITDLYNWAKSQGVEDLELKVNYLCSDDWYGLDRYELKERDLVVDNDEVIIDL